MCLVEGDRVHSFYFNLLFFFGLFVVVFFYLFFCCCCFCHILKFLKSSISQFLLVFCMNACILASGRNHFSQIQAYTQERYVHSTDHDTDRHIIRHPWQNIPRRIHLHSSHFIKQKATQCLAHEGRILYPRCSSFRTGSLSSKPSITASYWKQYPWFALLWVKPMKFNDLIHCQFPDLWCL